MKAIKSAMKLIVESQIAQPVEFRINKNKSEFIAKDEMWRLMVPVDCDSDIENTVIKLTHESFLELYKGIRAVKKELSLEISEDRKNLKFISKDEELVVEPTAVLVKEQKVYEAETLANLKVDDMLSFLNSVFSSRTNKFTPIDANVEIRFDHASIRFLHLTAIKMSELLLKNVSEKEYRAITIPTKQMNVAYSLFKNSLEFDGEIQESDNVLIFATNRFKLGLKKEHKDSVPLKRLFDLPVVNNFRFTNDLLNQLYAIKKSLTPCLELKVGDTTLTMEEPKLRPTKDDLMVHISQVDTGIKFIPYLCKSGLEIGQVTDGKAAFYDFAEMFEIAQSFVEPDFNIQVVNNHAMRFVNKTETVSMLLMPIIPMKRELLEGNE